MLYEEVFGGPKASAKDHSVAMDGHTKPTGVGG